MREGGEGPSFVIFDLLSFFFFCCFSSKVVFASKEKKDNNNRDVHPRERGTL